MGGALAAANAATAAVTAGLAVALAAAHTQGPPVASTLFHTLFASAVAAAVINCIFARYTARWHPADYAERPQKQVIWAASGTSLFLLNWSVPLIVCPELVKSLQEDGLTMERESGWGLSASCGVALGYMLYDLLDMTVINGALYQKGLGVKMWKQMVLHHIFSLALWPYSVVSGKATQCVAYFLFTEVTNVLMNTRWFASELKHPLLLHLSWMWAGSYVIVRLLPAPFLVWTMLRWDYSAWAYFEVAFAMATVIPVVLNVVWFRLIVRSGQRMLAQAARPRPPSVRP